MAGLARRPRAAIAPATPVRSFTLSTSSRLLMSPFAIRGTDAASLTALIASKSTGSLGLADAVRPWSAMKSTPMLSAILTMCTVSLRSGAILILIDIGMSFPARVRAWYTMLLIVSGLRRRADPIPSCTAHFWGHPQLRSIPPPNPPVRISSAASPNSLSVWAANWTMRGVSWGFVLNSMLRALCEAMKESAIIMGEYTISVPQLLTTCRQGNLLNLTMGAAILTHRPLSNRSMIPCPDGLCFSSIAPDP
eukprot:CAMPEP_0169452948 /NCGR_PEP_ID=MMETSP1042-20121227/14503_1 /TAXON_ID=464988 /ORGANISM="Hemiselmis andersenii, Strain CCMP1180" /LENGTH=249 /DNA_ID=CAMNT_0009564961 /DNA_START=210 /DNA_END=955 /DNA_ORIENTATION=+